MTWMLEPRQAAKLARIAGLLASPNEAERAVAAAKASALLDGARLTWLDVVRAAAVSGPLHVMHARWLLALGGDLLPAQRLFLRWVQLRRTLTPWERGVLASLTDMVEGRAT